MDRLITNKQLPNRSLLWRAILQHILLKHKPDLGVDDQQLGRIASKCTDFYDYVVKCFKKLGIELQMTLDEIQNIYAHQSEEYGHKLNSFYQLRSIFTPLIEGLILLDRLTYMHQQVNMILKILNWILKRFKLGNVSTIFKFFFSLKLLKL